MPKERSFCTLIVSGTARGTEFLKRLLSTPQFAPVYTADNAGQARRLLLHTPCDLVLINAPLPDEFGTDLAVETAQEGDTGVLLMVKNELFDQVAYKVESFGVLTVGKPAGQQAFYQAIKLLVATQARVQRLTQKNQTLQTRMREIRLINRAKLLLIQSLGMDETQAHHYIEKQAMDTRRPKTEVAEDIIRTYEN